MNNSEILYNEAHGKTLTVVKELLKILARLAGDLKKKKKNARSMVQSTTSHEQKVGVLLFFFYDHLMRTD